MHHFFSEFLYDLIFCAVPHLKTDRSNVFIDVIVFTGTFLLLWYSARMARILQSLKSQLDAPDYFIYNIYTNFRFFFLFIFQFPFFNSINLQQTLKTKQKLNLFNT